MTVVVSISEAKSRLSYLLRQMAAGEDVVIAEAGVPIARLVPTEDRSPRKPGQWNGKVTDAFFEPLLSEEAGV